MSRAENVKWVDVSITALLCLGDISMGKHAIFLDQY